MQPTSVLATITGRDRPGVTAAFFAALSAHDVDVCDVEQVVIRDRLILAVLFELRGDTAALRNSVTHMANALGMEAEVAFAEQFVLDEVGSAGRRLERQLRGEHQRGRREPPPADRQRDVAWPRSPRGLP